MEIHPAHHEKITDDEIKAAIEVLLKNTLHMKKKWGSHDKSLYEFFKTSEFFIFKLRRHFSPELTSICKMTLGELSEMMSNTYDNISEPRKMTRPEVEDD
jgi:hypothetical protein